MCMFRACVDYAWRFDVVSRNLARCAAEDRQPPDIAILPAQSVSAGWRATPQLATASVADEMQALLGPHLGKVVFDRSICDGTWRLGHLVTGEVVELPVPHGKWDIVYDGDGFGVLVDDNQRAMPVEDLFQNALYSVAGREVVNPEDERHKWGLQFLDDDSAKFDSIVVKLMVGQEAKEVHISVTSFRSPRRPGQRLFWSISDFYYGLNFTSLYQGHASRWYGARWKAWESQLEAWGCANSLIKSVRAQSSSR